MSARIRVSVVWATPAVQDVVPVELAAGATVAAAVAASRIADRHTIDLCTMRFALHGRLARPDTVLAEGDRVEICRPLAADPKEARRARAEAKSRALSPAAGKRLR